MLLTTSDDRRLRLFNVCTYSPPLIPSKVNQSFGRLAVTQILMYKPPTSQDSHSATLVSVQGGQAPSKGGSAVPEGCGWKNALGNVAHTLHLPELSPSEKVDMHIDRLLRRGNLSVQPSDIKEGIYITSTKNGGESLQSVERLDNRPLI